MSVGLSTHQDETVASATTAVHKAATVTVRDVISSVQDAVAPVWPLKDYVAVNPYGGYSGETLLAASSHLRSMSDFEMLMPVAYYRQRFQAGKFGLLEIETAIDEMVEDQVPGAESLCANSIYKKLSTTECADWQAPAETSNRLRAISEHYDRFNCTGWTETIHEEISKHCAAHYDEGQARWASPWKHLPLYEAWRETAQRDRRIEILGLKKFRDFAAKLPDTPEVAISFLLVAAGVPQQHWKDYLHCLALNLPGWSAWTKYKTVEATKQSENRPDFAALLAIRLAYDVALLRCFHFHVDVHADSGEQCQTVSDSWTPGSLVQYTLLKANEIGFRTGVLSGLTKSSAVETDDSTDVAKERKLAQMVFCIDVRSERIRRNLESTTDDIETFGFAGFFGLPIEYVGLGESCGTKQLPVLIDPQFQVHEDLRVDDATDIEKASRRRSRIRSLRGAWKRFQTSVVSCFVFVETTGLVFGLSLIGKMLGKPATDGKFDGVPTEDRDRLGPGFRELHAQGISTSRQADLAESILTNLGTSGQHRPVGGPLWPFKSDREQSTAGWTRLWSMRWPFR